MAEGPRLGSEKNQTSLHFQDVTLNFLVLAPHPGITFSDFTCSTQGPFGFLLLLHPLCVHSPGCSGGREIMPASQNAICAWDSERITQLHSFYTT